MIYQDAATVPYTTRALNYEHAMSDLAAENRKDVEAQVFYALALLANASPADKTHAKQKKAAQLLEPLDRDYPQHPGIPHYLIHAYDNAELAPQGLSAARAYSRIAPSAPHALHMPSHIFTRLGLWEDSIASNLAAREAAHQQGDTGEELHAMDYLVYAYLQSGRDKDATEVIQQLKSMPKLDVGDFKIAYASTAMPVRYAVERGRWADAVALFLRQEPRLMLSQLRFGLAAWDSPEVDTLTEARAEIDRLRQIEQQLRTSGNDYWATQVEILEARSRGVVSSDGQQAGRGRSFDARIRRRGGRNREASCDTGPIVPAREQLGSLLLEQNQPALALKEFEISPRKCPRAAWSNSGSGSRGPTF